MTGYLSVREAASRWDITTRQVQKLCSDGRIEGAVHFANSWAIPKDTIKPTRTVPVKPGPKPKKIRNSNSAVATAELENKK